MEKEIDFDELFAKTLEINGKMAQLKQLQEEAAEVVLAVRKLERAIDEQEFAGTEPIEKAERELKKEIADIAIMTAQALLIYGENEIAPLIQLKLAKHRDWLNKKINSQVNGTNS